MRDVGGHSHRKPSHDQPKRKLANPSSKATSSCNQGRGPCSPCSPGIGNWAAKVHNEHRRVSITCDNNKRKRVGLLMQTQSDVHYSQQTEATACEPIQTGRSCICKSQSDGGFDGIVCKHGPSASTCRKWLRANVVTTCLNALSLSLSQHLLVQRALRNPMGTKFIPSEIR